MNVYVKLCFIKECEQGTSILSMIRSRPLPTACCSVGDDAIHDVLDEIADDKQITLTFRPSTIERKTFLQPSELSRYFFPVRLKVL